MKQRRVARTIGVTLVVAAAIGAGQVTLLKAANITMGETNVLSIGDSGNAGVLLAQRATLSQTATIQSLSFYVSNAAGKLRLGVYDASGPSGGPGIKIAETSEITPIAGWNTAPVSSPVTLAAATYWLAYAPSSGSLGFRRSGTGSFRMYSRTYGPLPSTFSTSASSGVDHWSFYATLTTGETQPPSAPTGLSATVISSSEIDLAWTASSDNVGVAGYRIVRNGSQLTTVAGTSYADTSVAASTTYTYSVTAYDAAGNVSAPSASVTASTPSATADTVPPTGTITINGGASVTNTSSVSLSLSATDASSSVSQMRFSNSSFGFSTPEPYATTKGWTLSTGDGTKTVYVRFQDAAGNWSSSFTDTIVLDTTPPAISSVSASNITNASAVISWTTSEPATSQVEYGPTTSYGSLSPLDAARVSSHSVTIGPLTANTTYSYRARSKDAAGNERFGSQGTFRTLAGPPDTVPPTVPTNVAPAPVSDRRIDLSWTASTDAVGVTGYKVFRDGQQIGTTSATSSIDANLQPGTSYSYRVAAYDAAGNTSAQSAAASATTLADTTPPTVTVATPGDNTTVSGTVDVTATGVADDVGVAGVTFQLDGASIASEDDTPPYAAALDTRLFLDGAHEIRAIARDTSNNVTTSAPVHVTINNTSAPPSGTPTLIQHVSTASNNNANEAGNPFFISLPNPAGAGNAIILGMSFPYASSGRTATVTDDKGNLWVAAVTVPGNPTTGQFVSRLFYALGVAAGTQNITVTFDAPVHSFQSVVSEFYNVATAGALDGSSANSSSAAPGVTAGTLTTANAGDLVYSYAFDTTPTERITRFTAGAGFTLLSADTALGNVAQYAVQNNEGTITPGVTVTGGSDRFNALAIALRSQGAGTAPGPGIRIVHVYHVLYTRIGSALQFPSTGNLLVVTTAFSPNQSNLHVSTTPSNVWSKPTPASAADVPQFLYAANATTSPNLLLTPTTTFPLTTIVMYDVAGAATSPYDATAGVPSSWQSNRNNSDLVGLPVISPTAPRELIFALLNDGIGPTVGLVGSGFVLDTITYGGEVDDDSMDNADGYAHYFSTGTSQVSFRWKMNSSRLPETSLGVAIGFKSAP
jgi:chitodextrinase